MTDVRLDVLSSDTSPENRDALQRIARDLGALIQGEVRFSHHDRMLYATDASIYQVAPIGVVIPQAIDDVPPVIEYCRDHDLPILPRGSGASLAGQTVNAAVVIDFSAHCRRIHAIDRASRTAVVEPGVVLDQLNAQAAPHGLMFGPDVATSTHATLGGMIGNNSSGVHSILYGRTVEHVLALEVILADGSPVYLEKGAAESNERVRDLTMQVADVVRPLAPEIRTRYPRTLRRVNGYNLDLFLDQLERSRSNGLEDVNLAHLLCGAEGTLGVTTRATVRLVETPKCKGLAVVAFATLLDAMRAVPVILELAPAAVELLDNIVLDLAGQNAEYRRYVNLLPMLEGVSPAAVLYVEFFADDQAARDAKLKALQSIFADRAVRTYTDAVAMDRAWKLRKAGEPLLHGIPGLRKPLTFIEDTAVDPSRLAAFIDEFDRMVRAHGTTAAYYAHASVGCLHIRPLICLHEAAERSVMQRIAEQATDLVKRYEGALSGEHGDGRARSHLLERFYGPDICNAFRRIKAIFDPANRLNPGNIVEPVSMIEALRVEPVDRPALVPDVQTYYRYDREHGFAAAVEMCNGAGVCRKTDGGTMCPSYQALLDERHATRGRGNALRLAITGQFSNNGVAPAWDDPETMATLDLCLSCKACKTECPSNVDIAKLKAEYTAQRYAMSGGAPRRSRLFASIRRLNRAASAVHPFANAVTRFGPTAALVKRVAGVDRRRSLPGVGQSLYRWLAARQRNQDATAPAVILYPDCFTVYSEPAIGRAAVGVLEALGYRVVLPKIGCCGRAAISLGMLEDAQRLCADTARQLAECVERERGIAIVGCEPSCISAITDDWIDLDMPIDRSVINSIVGKTMLIEQFIDEAWSDHPKPVSPAADDESTPILLHGHCHQKALWGIDSSAAILRRLFGDRLNVLDTGCCGMAGSFGYTPDHFDLSMSIANLALLPAIREAKSDAVVLAPGTSCRHQIHDGAGRSALHPIELIARVLGE